MVMESTTPALFYSLEEFVQQERNAANAATPTEDWSSVPLLNCSSPFHLRDHSLVRFRGMIQDMLNPEVYMERYEVKSDEHPGERFGKYRDCCLLNEGEEINFESEMNTHSQRRSLFVVSMPGLNTWVSDYEKQFNTSVLLKQPENNNEEQMDVDEAKDVGPTINKRQRLNNNEQESQQIADKLNAEYMQGSPLQERPSSACWVQLYKDFDDFWLCSMIEVLGYISCKPISGMRAEWQDDMNAAESLNNKQYMPRVHAIAVRVLKNANPLLDRCLQTCGIAEPAELKMLSVQKEMMTLLKLCLFNDELAAEYLLAHLISKIYNRTDMQAVGKFALNLCNLPKQLPADYTKQLYEILELLLPVSHYLPMTLNTLNTSKFVPKKDHTTDRLLPGMLQLARHTHLILDETQLQQGNLDANGVNNVCHIAYLINNQQIKCDFEVYNIDYDVDVPVLVLSEGRSMLPNDFVLPLKADADSVRDIEESLKAAKFFLQPARLTQFRRFLTKASESNLTMHAQDTEMIEKDFVEMRKSNTIKSAEELHALMVLSRYSALARGQLEFSSETWQLAKQMEVERMQRMQQLPQSSTSKGPVAQNLLLK